MPQKPEERKTAYRASSAAEEAILFSIHDMPVFEALGLYREEAYGEHGGHQPVTSVFDG